MDRPKGWKGDGDEYVINGQKIFTILAHRADYCWLAARTGSDDSRCKWLSMLAVDMKTPGITVRPLIGILERRTYNEVFFDHVRVPRECMVGGENQGWLLLVTELDIERTSFGVGVNISARSKRVLEQLVEDSAFRAIRLTESRSERMNRSNSFSTAIG